jgi:NTP pyrophosphatase (non-canonical NTP hydrolase)
MKDGLDYKAELEYVNGLSQKREPFKPGDTDVDKFGEWAASVWFSKDPEDKDMGERDLAIMGLGIAGEAGEVVEKIKKDIRDHFIDKPAILKELGDVVYYAFAIARYYGFKPSDILRANYEKLMSRRERGTERGSGDNR